MSTPSAVARRNLWYARCLPEVPAAVAIVATCVLWRQPYLLAAVGVVLSVWDVSMFPRRRAAVRVWLFGAVFGPLAEIVAIWAGAWTYTVSTVAGIPVWLAPLWGIAALFFARRARRMFQMDGSSAELS